MGRIPEVYHKNRKNAPNPKNISQNSENISHFFPKPETNPEILARFSPNFAAAAVILPAAAAKSKIFHSCEGRNQASFHSGESRNPATAAILAMLKTP
ncbi:MAG: hypothetical protein HAW59_05820 [Betaproteobacteria bacterium]|nr:hypothetical protein [Betaproteobacteria bacterium]